MLFLRVPKRTSNGAIKLKASEASPTACDTDDAGFLVAQAPGRFISLEIRLPFARRFHALPWPLVFFFFSHSGNPLNFSQ
jgi:hypothetical protein